MTALASTSSLPPLPKPDKIVTYPVGSEDDVGALFLFGDAGQATRLIFMCAGYPDDHENFLPLAHRLATQTKSFVGVTCLPGFDDRPDRPYTANKPEGYSFQEWVGAFKEALKVLKRECPKKVPLVGVFHDWAVLSGLMWTNQTVEEDGGGNSPDRIVLFDVLLPPHPDDRKRAPTVPRDTVREVVTTLTYRVMLASCFAIRRYVSKALAQIAFGMGWSVLSLFRLNPTGKLDEQTVKSHRQPMTPDRLVYMAYPYYNLMKSFLTNRMAEDLRKCYLPRDLRKTPVLYMYGTDKRVMFHDKSALALLKQEREKASDAAAAAGSGSDAIEVQDAGHWLYLHRPDLCFDAVANFVKDA